MRGVRQQLAVRHHGDVAGHVRRRLFEVRAKVVRRHRQRYGGGAQHSGQALDERRAAADLHGVRHRARHETCVLAGEEHLEEPGGGFRDHGHPVAFLQAGVQEPMGGAHGAIAQLGIGQHVFESTAGRVEGVTGFAPSCVIKPFGQGVECAKPLRKAAVYCRRRLQTVSDGVRLQRNA